MRVVWIGMGLFVILMAICFFYGIIPDIATPLHKIVAIGGSLATLGLPLWVGIYQRLKR